MKSMIQKSFDAFMGYNAGGMGNFVGFEPIQGVVNGTETWAMPVGDLAFNRSNMRFSTATSLGIAGVGNNPLGMNIGTASLAGSLGMSIMSVGTGLATGGIHGAWEAGIRELASSAGQMKFGHRRVMDAAGVMTINPDRVWWGVGALGKTTNNVLNAGRMIGTGIGGSIGAGIGQSIAGTPGAFLGGYVGAAAATGRGGLVAAGALAVASPAIATLGASYAAYKIGQYGADINGRRRRIDTSGDMSAFMTNNAMTMRSRAVQAIHKSHLNARSALGHEAGFMHTNKNYFSRYR